MTTPPERLAAAIDHVPRWFRMPYRYKVRPPFSWKHHRQFLSLWWLQFIMFLLFWVLFWCWWTYLVMSTSYGSSAGMRVDLNRYLGSDSVLLIGENEWADPVLVRCLERLDDLEAWPGLVCVQISPGGLLWVDSQRIEGPGAFGNLLEDEFRIAGSLEVVIYSQVDTGYDEFLGLLDWTTQVFQDLGLPVESIKIRGCRYTTLSGEIRVRE